MHGCFQKLVVNKLFAALINLILFISTVQNDPVIAEMDGESVALIKWAHRRVIDVERSLKDGSITLHELNQLVKEKEKTQRLLKASGVSIVNISSFETAIVKLKEYVDVVSTLFHSLRPCFKG